MGKQFLAALAFAAFLTLCFWRPPAEAGSHAFQGKITVSSGACKNNVTTATPFQLGRAGTKYVIQCPDAGAWICENRGTCAVGTGTMTHAGAQYCGKVEQEVTDGGIYKSLITVCPLSGSTDTECIIQPNPSCP